MTLRKVSALLPELGAAILVSALIWGIGVVGLEIVRHEIHALAALEIPRGYILLAAPLFLGGMSYLLVTWSRGYKGPAELSVLLKQKTSVFPGWIRATLTWVIACIELGTGLSPKGFEGPYIAAGGGLSGRLAAKLSLNHAARRRLARCGLGVAFGVLFQTPLGGLVCIFEFGNLQKTAFKEQLPSAAIATLTSYALTVSTGWPTPFEPLPLLPTVTMSHLFILFGIGLACGLAGLWYVASIRFSKRFFGSLEKRIPLLAIPILGATISTALGALFPLVIGSNELTRVIALSSLAPALLLGIIVAKIIATAAADGSKCAGGTVGPAILLGGLIGKLIGGANPLFAAAGAAAVIGPIAGLSTTMFVTTLTWLDFAPAALLIALPLLVSIVITHGMELYPTTSPTSIWPPYRQHLRTLRLFRYPRKVVDEQPSI